MRFFIHTVTPYKIKTSKARLIQSAAAPFEHAMLDDSDLNALFKHLQLVVDLANRYHSGETIHVQTGSEQILVRYQKSQRIILLISYAKVRRDITFRGQIREAIQNGIEGRFPEDCARYLIIYSQKGGAL